VLLQLLAGRVVPVLAPRLVPRRLVQRVLQGRGQEGCRSWLSALAAVRCVLAALVLPRRPH